MLKIARHQVPGAGLHRHQSPRGLIYQGTIGRVQMVPGVVFQLDVQAGFFLELPILQVVVQTLTVQVKNGVGFFVLFTENADDEGMTRDKLEKAVPGLPGIGPFQ